MIILSHRGYWKSEEERNQEVAFHRSFDLGYGTETDIRDIQGKLVISHDMPQGNEITFEELLQIMDSFIQSAIHAKMTGRRHSSFSGRDGNRWNRRMPCAEDFMELSVKPGVRQIL